MTKETGSSAFPRMEWNTAHQQMMAVGGMTLRDYFAAKAMHLLLAQQDFPEGFDYGQKATWAYKMADAMLEARK